MTLPSYDSHPTWRRYQPFFPEGMRCTPASTPTESHWRWRDLDVHLDRLDVPGAPLKVIVLHGAGAYGRVMAPASVIAHRYGYATVAPDLPGYGLTRVPWRRMSYPLWIDCVCDLVDAELARDGTPIVLFGVSLGGLLAYQVAARIAASAATAPARAAALRGLLVTTIADPREPATRRGFARNRVLGGPGLWLLDRLAPLTDGLPLPMARVSRMDRISNRRELSALVASDRLGGGSWVPARFLRTLMTTAPAVEPEAFTACPVLLAHPGNDRMTELELSRRFFDRLAAPKRLVVLDGASHMPTEHPGVDQLEAAAVDFLRTLHAPRATAGARARQL
ncbi:MAG TPA: alpha/beta fold hydrolase [Kofleriaceae bacterium]|nr:alpha/beta fold hydrolase [Kofleriaceae bacterium]